MKWLWGMAMICAVSSAQAAPRCPPGTYPARYSFGIWVCKQPMPPNLACPPGRHLARDMWGTPSCMVPLSEGTGAFMRNPRHGRGERP